jgi:translin
MQGLDAIGEQMHALLREKNSARDKALEQSRTLIRYSSLAIRAVHREERDVAAENLRLAKAQAAELEKGLAKYPDLNYAGYTQDALKELAEASIVFALVGDLPLPNPADLGVEAAAYLNGLGEAAGELRRWSLDLLRRGKTADAERVLAMMDRRAAPHDRHGARRDRAHARRPDPQPAAGSGGTRGGRARAVARQAKMNRQDLQDLQDLGQDIQDLFIFKNILSILNKIQLILSIGTDGQFPCHRA